MAKKNQKETIDKRRKRDYVGEEIAQDPKHTEKQPETQANIKESKELQEPAAASASQPAQEKKKRKGLFDGIFKAKEKMIKLYECPGCEVDNPEDMVAFTTPEELGQHLYDIHGIKLIEEDIQACLIEVKQDIAAKIIKGMEEATEQLKQEEIKQAKRFENALGIPKEEEPEELIDPQDPKNPGEVYSKTIEKITSPQLNEPTTADQETFIESIVDGKIEVTIIKRFPLSKDVLNALQTLKLAQV